MSSTGGLKLDGPSWPRWRTSSESRARQGEVIPEEHVKLKTVVAAFCGELERLVDIARTGGTSRGAGRRA
jgi:hypothetical protein